MVWFGGLLYGIGAIQCSMVQGSIVWQAWYGVLKLSMVQCSVAWYCMVLGSLLAGAGSINSLV